VHLICCAYCVHSKVGTYLLKHAMLKENNYRVTLVKLIVPLWEESVFCYIKSLPQHLELPLSQELHQNIRNLQIWKNILKNHCFHLNTVFEEMVLNVDILRAIMNQWILIDHDATLIVTVHYNRFQHLIDQLCYQLAKPYGLTTSRIGCYILCLHYTKCHCCLLATILGNHTCSQAETKSQSALPNTCISFLVRINKSMQH
jgi:hypothetical protein